jgi:hypothetical protein
LSCCFYMSYFTSKKLNYCYFFLSDYCKSNQRSNSLGPKNERIKKLEKSGKTPEHIVSVTCVKCIYWDSSLTVIVHPMFAAKLIKSIIHSKWRTNHPTFQMLRNEEKKKEKKPKQKQTNKFVLHLLWMIDLISFAANIGWTMTVKELSQYIHLCVIRFTWFSCLAVFICHILPPKNLIIVIFFYQIIASQTRGHMLKCWVWRILKLFQIFNFRFRLNSIIILSNLNKV